MSMSMSLSIVSPKAGPRTVPLAVLVADRDGEPGFASGNYCRLLCEAGLRLGLDVVVVTPGSLLAAGAPCGFRPDPAAAATGGGWRRVAAPVPGLVYDRHFAATRRELQRYREALQFLLEQPGVRLLGRGLPGKLAVQRMLRRDAELAPFLPQTAPLRSARGLLAALASSGGELFLKPDGGSQGRGAMHVRLEPDGGAVAVLGRTPGNAPFSRRFRDGSSFAEWLQRNVGQRPYLVQPYLALTDRTGAPYDIRCLVQKNGRGAWQLTGMAVRHGRPAGVTANLHGGGAALPATSFLAGEFGPEAAAIAADLKRLAVRVPETLEAQHGRLVELGIDFGVDRSGRIWLIEVNSKPGRAAFVRIGSPQTWRTAVESPLRYARFMSTPAETGSSDFAHTKCSGGPTP